MSTMSSDGRVHRSENITDTVQLRAHEQLFVLSRVTVGIILQPVRVPVFDEFFLFGKKTKRKLKLIEKLLSFMRCTYSKALPKKVHRVFFYKCK